MNKFKVSGLIQTIYKNDKVVMVKIKNSDKKKVYDITASAFDLSLMQEIEANEKEHIEKTYVGYIYDTCYKDKKTQNFINKTTLVITDIE